MNDQYSEYLSPEGLNKLKDELRYLGETRRVEIAAALDLAKSFGDLSENAEYSQAKDDQAANEVRIAEVGYILQHAVVVSNHSSEIVGVGAKVVAKHSTLGTQHEFKIVSSEEADPLVQKISYESPIGRALMGKRKGEEATVNTPKGAVVYKILEIV
jgi:transcription elongation factor GreA